MIAKEIRVRLAPSPTGLLHIGTVRTALYNFLFARKHGGVFILRLEDTDTVRSEKQYEDDIIIGLQKMGLTYDEGPDKPRDCGPYRQSERTALYRKYLEELMKNGDAYPCYCSVEVLEAQRREQQARKEAPRYIGTCRDLTEEQRHERESSGITSTIRFKTPASEHIQFTDIIRGDQDVLSDEIGDFIIARSIDNVLFNFAVVIDDVTMRITHVIRGEDHLPNTPKQVLIYRALKMDIPQFAHLPMILNPDRSKMSKRKNPVSVSYYVDQGYLPEALINYLALVGWNPGTEQEIFTLDELIQLFSLEKVHKGGAIFDMQKLNWMNGMYIRALTPAVLLEKVRPYWKNAATFSGDEYLLKIITVLRERLERLAQIDELTSFFFEEPACETELLVPKKATPAQVRANLITAQSALEKLSDFSKESTEQTLLALCEQLNLKKGELLWPIRAALSGKKESPGTFELLWVLGKTKSLERIGKAIEKLPA